MQLESKLADIQEAAHDIEIHFPEGIPAFEDAQNFALVGSEDTEPFVQLLSRDMEGLGFLCVNPCLLVSDYDVRISDEDRKQLKLTHHEEAPLLAFVSPAERREDVTVNLLAPIVVNVRNRLAKQIIADGYPIRFNMWEAIQRGEVEQCEEGERC